MSTSEDLNCLIRASQAAWNNALTENRIIDEKIEALRRARDYAERARDKAGNVRGAAENTAPPHRWAGNHADKFMESMHGAAQEKARTLVCHIIDLTHEIDGEIQRLESQRNHFVSIIDGAQRAISAYQASLRRLNG